MNRRLIIPTVLGGAVIPFADKVTALTPYWWLKMNETSGTNINDLGTANNDGTLTIGSGSLGQAGIGDGGTSILFDGTTTVISGSTISVAAGIGELGTLAYWVKSTNIWTDSTNRYTRIDRADNANYFRVGKDTANRISLLYRAGGGTAITTVASSVNTTEWCLLAGTWNRAGNATAIYQIQKGGTVLASATGAASGAWSAGNALFQCGFAGNILKDYICHMMVFPTALTQAQLQNLANV